MRQRTEYAESAAPRCRPRITLPIHWHLVCVISLGVASSASVWGLLNHRERQLLQTEFLARAKERAVAVSREVQDDVDLLYAASAFFAGSDHVEEREFLMFVRPLTGRAKSIVALEWAPRVKRENREEFERRLPKGPGVVTQIMEVGEEAALRPAADRVEYFPVEYSVGPPSFRKAALGFDHASDAVAIAGELNIPIAGVFDLVSHWEQKHGTQAIGFNTGGTIRLGGVAVTMVSATHSSSHAGEDGPLYGGTESGYMIAGEGRTIYVSGDTDVMADMAIFEDLHHPEVGILCAGGHFTMDMKRAAYAAKRFFNFKVVMPCHYRTFPLLEQSAAALAKELPGVRVIEPEVLQAIEL